MSAHAYSASDSDASENSENAYCIFLHIVEAIGLNRREGAAEFSERHKDKIIMNASLNGVKFEVEGHSTETSTIFNSNCVWECELGDIKRIKTDNRPVKLECFTKSGRSEHSPRKTIGSLLLPIRGVQIVSALRNVQLKLHWHKLGGLSSEWRHNKPEIYLLLAIVKKSLVDNGQFETFLGKKKYSHNDALSPHGSETSLMLQSQSNVYVQLLEQVGLIQVGNNPDVDCDILNVALTFKQVKNLEKLLERERNCINRQKSIFVFHYDFLGSVSQLEIVTNPTDCYTINEKISLNYKTSLRSLRTYFERIFYIPINLYLNGVAIANYRFDFSKLLPDDAYFNLHKVWSKCGVFHFDRLHKILSPRAAKPSVDFLFSVQLLTSYSKKANSEIATPSETFMPYRIDEKAAGDNVASHRKLSYEAFNLHNRHYNPIELSDRNYIKAHSETMSVSHVGEKDDLFLKSSEEFVKETSTEKDDVAIQNMLSQRRALSQSSRDEQYRNDENLRRLRERKTRSVSVNTNYFAVRAVGVNTESSETGYVDPEELTYKIVQELEEWKSQQMEHFVVALQQKEAEHLSSVDQQWQQQRLILQARLEAKIAKCEELNAKLEKANVELQSNAAKNTENTNIVEVVKRDIERNYAEKFQTLDTQMNNLKMEVQQKRTMSEIETKNVEIENTRLEHEKNTLKERIEHLESQLVALQKSHFSADQLKDVLADLRQQTERLADVEKSKNYYKDQWSKTTSELHKLKLNLLKDQEKNLLENQSNGVDICLEEILNDEQEALCSDRGELNIIKDALFDISDSSSENGDLNGM